MLLKAIVLFLRSHLAMQVLGSDWKILSWFEIGKRGIIIFAIIIVRSVDGTKNGQILNL